MPSSMDNRISILGAIICILAIPIWLLVVAPILKKIPSHFTYTADILSIDNFYDEGAKKFEGEHISKTTFTYTIEEQKPGFVVIKNTFTVKKLSDKPIFSVSRLYDIDPLEWKHVAGIGEENRSGHLFGPRNADKSNFYYWHINYNAPALMKFVDKQKIDGLTVYHYEAHYASDQTANLTNLPGVPNIRGIKTDIYLQLWIEPVSGWLVKYQDNTLAYYYDRKTEERLVPWNQFSNRYTQNSIREQVGHARILKWKILTINYGVPILLFLLAIMIFYHDLRHPIKFSLNKYKEYIYSTLVLFLLASVFGISFYYFIWLKKSENFYVVGISKWNNNPGSTSAVQGFKDGLAQYQFIEGKNIRYLIKSPNSNLENQIDIIQSFIHQNVDLIFTLTTPGTLIAKGMTKQIPIVFSDVSYPVQGNIVASLKSSENNLVGTRNYIQPAQQFYVFEKIYPNIKKLGFVHHKGDPDSEIQYIEYKNMLAKRNIEVIDIAATDLAGLRQELEKTPNYNALFLACDTLMQEGGGEIAAQISLRNKIPSLSCTHDGVAKGALVGYIADLYAIGKLAGSKAALILRGADPKWLHSESSKNGLLIINLKTANLLGITIPNDILQQASQVIKK